MTAYAVPSAITPATLRQVYTNAVAITPADNTQIGPFRGFTVGVSGSIVICPINSATPVTLQATAGFIYPIAIQGVNATGTTATGIVGLG